MSSANKLSKLKKTRGGHRSATMRIIAELEEELIASSAELDLVKILQLKKSIEDKLSILEKLDSEILDLLEEEEQVILRVQMDTKR